MSDLVFIAFPSVEKAEEVRTKILEMQKDYLIEVGDAVGAAAGALGGSLADVGIQDAKMKEAAQALKPGEAGLFLLIRKMTTDKVLADLEGVGGTVISTSFDHAKEDALKAALAPHVPA